MPFTIILALCCIGAVSASSLNKRSFIDDIQNNTQNYFYAFEQFGENFNEKVQEAFKNLFSAFGNKNQSLEAPISITNGSNNSFDLVAFAQDLLEVLAPDVAPGRRQRDAAEDLKKFSDEAKHNSEEALKKIFAFFKQFKPQSSQSSDAVNIAKHNAVEAIKKLFSLFEQTKSELSELSKAFTIAKFSVDDALWKFITLFEQCKPQSSELSTAFTVAKYSAEDAVWKLISLFGQLQDTVAKTSSSSRGKRASVHSH